VSAYYGRFPVPRARVRIFAGGGTGNLAWHQLRRRRRVVPHLGGPPHDGCGSRSRLDADARDGALRVSFGGAPASLDRRGHRHLRGAHRAGSHRQPDRRRGMGRHAAGHAPGPAGGRRSRSGQHAHLGQDLLGRRAFLPAGGYRNPEEYGQCQGIGGRVAGHQPRGRHHRGGLAAGARVRDGIRAMDLRQIKTGPDDFG
jgi:hypothetical protein